MSSSFVRLGRAALLVPVFFLVACNATTSTENGDGEERGASGSGAVTSVSGAGGGAGGSEAGSPQGGSTSSAGGDTSAAGTAAASGGTTASAGNTSTGGAGTGGAGQGGALNPDVIFDAHFTAAELGPYAREEIQVDFGAEATWDNGLSEGRATIEEEESNRFLRVTFPGGIYGPAGGVQFLVDLGGSHEELYFAYRVRFQADFDFNMGGKLPGFSGGTRPTGCAPDEGGFSARNMWRNGNGAIVQYVYWPDQPNTCGDDLYYDADGDDVLFTPGSWQTIEHHVRMNTPGQNDGVLECWVDGQSRFNDTSRQWRKTDAFAIDGMFFSTFFGGGSQVWASPKEQSVDFDDLIVSRAPITH